MEAGKFYVYALLDTSKKVNNPRAPKGMRFEPYYIGKGTDSRRHVHIRNAERLNYTHNPKLTEKIRDLIKRGIATEVLVVKYFQKEEEAYEYESELIRIFELWYKGGTLMNGGYGKAGGWGNVQNPTYARMKEGTHNFQQDNPAFSDERVQRLEKRLMELDSRIKSGNKEAFIFLDSLVKYTGYSSKRAVQVGAERIIVRRNFNLMIKDNLIKGR